MRTWDPEKYALETEVHAAAASIASVELRARYGTTEHEPGTARYRFWQERYSVAWARLHCATRA